MSKNKWSAYRTAIAAGFITVVLFLTLALPHELRSSPAPGLKTGAAANGLLLLTVTNGVPGEYYQIYTTPTLDAGFNWMFLFEGAIAQTNFVVATGPASSGFFLAIAGADSDGDGVENWRDSDPLNSSLGALTVTIEAPANGSTIY